MKEENSFIEAMRALALGLLFCIPIAIIGFILIYLLEFLCAIKGCPTTNGGY